MTHLVLTATLHDPGDAQLAQALRVLPLLRRLYGSVVILASPSTGPHSLQSLRAAGCVVEQRAEGQGTLETLGLVRAAALERALQAEATHLHFCDWDRIIHWAEAWPEELEEVVAAIPDYDFLILGRTSRAWASHPRVQRDTEAMINHVFGLAWGQPLDITAASRGLSRDAAERILAGCREPSLGNDGAWPLFLARDPELNIGYAATEGLEWETPDRHAEAIQAMGGLDAWLAAFDADLGHWSDRLRLAYLEVEAIKQWRLVNSDAGNGTM